MLKRTNRLMMDWRLGVGVVVLLLMVGAGWCFGARPNIVVMLADDMGYGEVQCLNPKRGKIPTPQLDRIAASGMAFTDGHSGSSVCTPTRYGLMTGRYAWRTRLQNRVLQGGESLIAEDRLTVAKLLKQQGYHTAIIGKWHLGMLFDGKKQPGLVPVGARVTHGPLDRGGFDEFCGYHHAGQMNLWVENDRVARHLEPIEMLPSLTAAAVAYIKRRSGNEQPFFLYVPWNSPHGPVVPTKAWQGKSGLNAHADFVMQTDDSYGQVFRALEETGLIDNTLVICSADNGTSGPSSHMDQLIKKGHYPSANLRGAKADIWDGGHRVPFLVSWKGVVAPGSRSNRLVCLTDLFATAADILGVTYPETAAEDSISFYPVLKGEPGHARADVIHHSITGRFAIRQGDWKLILGPGSGGWSLPRDVPAQEKGLPAWQLYNMEKDIGERNNRFPDLPERVQQLKVLLQKQVADGRSTPGIKLTNDVKVDVKKAAVRRKAKSTSGKAKK